MDRIGAAKEAGFDAVEVPSQCLTIEPIDAQDMPGYFMSNYGLARRVIEAVDAPNLRLPFDTYHAQRILEDALALWAQMRDLVTHVQISQCPHRSEPIAGEIAFPAFLVQIADDGYDGWVSGEYRPVKTTAEGLSWMTAN